MSASTIRAQYAIPDRYKTTLKSFTRQSIKGVYQGTIRKQAAALGYPNRAVKLSNPAALTRLDAHANRVADSIVTTVNRMLDTQLAKMPAGLTDEEITARLQPFLKAVTAYNSEVLIPFSSNFARSQAMRDFTRENGIKSTWAVDPADTSSDDVCAEAIDLGEVDSDTMQSYEFPAHQRCPHSWAVVSTDASSLPAADDLWLGED